jgi:sirohydrochlorin ferrochelatase
MDDQPMAELLLVAHGTRSAAGSATTSRLVDAIGDLRRDVSVRLCFLDVARPSLAEALAQTRAPTVLVPLLLSTGYHTVTDIPRAVAGRSDVQIAAHLGPDGLLVDVLVDRLAAVRSGGPADRTILVGAGSSHAEAVTELARTADLLAARLDRRVDVLTMASDLPAEFAAASGRVEVATYLLAEGQFVDTLRSAAQKGGSAAQERVSIAEPLGVHPALVSLVWARYDAALGRVTEPSAARRRDNK